MIDRRAEPRIRLDMPGRICLDEHHSLSCLVYDQSEGGVRVTLPNAELVPETFVLALDRAPNFFICQTVWRNAEEIGAQTQVA